MSIPCPTCGASGTDPCIRGRAPRPTATIGSLAHFGDAGWVWRQQIPFPQGHDSRRTVNKERS